LEPGTVVVAVDDRYYRPTEVDLLIGDASKAREKLGWQPTCNLEGLVDEMMASDIELYRRQLSLKRSGFTTLNQYE